MTAPLKLVLSVVALAVLSQPVWSQSFTLVTTGAPTINPLISNFIFSFRSVNPSVAIQFAGTATTTDAQARQATLAAPGSATVDFAMSNYPYTSADVASATSLGLGALVSIPFTASPTVISYSLPTTQLASGTFLTLDRTAIFKIFTRATTFWNDGYLRTLNTQTVLLSPANQISIVYRGDHSGSTNTFLKALNSFGSSLSLPFPNPNWVDPTTDLPVWPFSNANCPNANLVSSDKWVLSFSTPIVTDLNCSQPLGTPIPLGQLVPQKCNVASGYQCVSGASSGAVNTLAGDLLTSVIVSFNPYSVSYMPLSMLYAGQPVANVVNAHGDTIVATAITAAVQAALTSAVGPADATSPVGSMSGVIDSQAAGAYPIVEMGWYTLPLLVSTDCARALQIALFLIWSIQSNTATSAMTFLGYVPLPTDMQKTVINTITTLRCGTASSSQAAFDALQSDESALQIISFIFGALLILLSLVLVWKRNHPSIRQLSFPVMMFLCLGASGNVFTVSLYVGHPTQSTCNAIPWVKILELVTVYCVFVVRVKHWLRIKDDDDELQISENAHHEGEGNTAAATLPATIEMGDKKGAIASVQSTSSHESMSDSSKRIRWALICLSVLLLWVIIPIVWTSIEPPTMQQRTCIGSLRSTFILIYLFFNILLILVTTIFAYLTNELDQVVHPIFIMLFDLALFEPMSFIIAAQQFPNRSPVALTLQPAVGILLGTILEVALILGPNLLDALRFTPEEVLARIALQKDVNTFRRQSTAQISKRKSSSTGAVVKTVEAAN